MISPMPKKLSKKPIAPKNVFTLKLNGVIKDLNVNDILGSLRSLQYVPTEIKTNAVFQIGKEGGKMFNRAYSPLRFRFLLARDIDKQLLTKFLSQALI